MSSGEAAPDPSKGNPEQVLRLFFSADLATGSSFKYKHPPLSDTARHQLRELGYKRTTPWTEVFGQFFEYFASQFRTNIQSLVNSFHIEHYPVRIWKIQGDEILFYTELTCPEQVYWQIRAFAQTVRDADDLFSQDFGLGVKGACWTAGFPIRNTRIVIHTSENPHVVLVKDEGNFVLTTREVPLVEVAPGPINAIMTPFHTLADFIGVEMDHGFRLCGYTHSGRVVASVDACYFASLGKTEAQNTLMKRSPGASQNDRAPSLRFAHLTWRVLKGVFGDLPVPVLWVEFRDMNDDRTLRHSFDAEESELVRLYLDPSKCPLLSADDYLRFFSDYHRSLIGRGVDHIIPYIKPEGMPNEQRQFMESSSKEDGQH